VLPKPLKINKVTGSERGARGWIACHSASSRGVEGPRRCLSAHAFRSFSATAARLRICASDLRITLERNHSEGQRQRWARKEAQAHAQIIFEFKGLTQTGRRKMSQRMQGSTRDHSAYHGGSCSRASVVEELLNSIGQISNVGVLRLRAAKRSGTRSICEALRSEPVTLLIFSGFGST
jgi:hypothetical protein